MLKELIWGPVSGASTVTRHGTSPLTPLKYVIGHTFLNKGFRKVTDIFFLRNKYGKIDTDGKKLGIFCVKMTQKRHY